MVTFYRVNNLSWWMGKCLVRVPFYSMVNLVAGRRIVPELIQNDMTAGRLAARRWRCSAMRPRANPCGGDLQIVARKLSGPEDPMEVAASHGGKAFERGNGSCLGRSYFVRWLRLRSRARSRSCWPRRTEVARRARIDVENYAIDAEINPHTQALTANVKVRFLPLDNDISIASFELNNALNVSRVVDDAGHQIPASRSGQDFGLRLSFPAPLAKGKPTTLTFTYDGRLTGQEDSPVYGIKFAAIQNDFAYLMYPARWFPVNDYTMDRYTADLHITVPSGFKVIASGLGNSQTSAGADKTVFSFQYTKPSFPGSIAVVQGDPQTRQLGRRDHVRLFPDQSNPWPTPMAKRPAK